MLMKNKLSPEKKLETQQRIIEQFEKEKVQLLDAIETLTFEKEFDKENNTKSIKLAKSLIESMEKQMATMAECIDELNVYKAEYKKCIGMLRDSLRKHSLHMNESLNESLRMKESSIRKGATQ